MPRRSAALTRTRILEAATATFKAQGFARTSVREIAAAADADPALVIRHFGSKELLFLEAMRSGIGPRTVADAPLDLLGRRLVGELLDGDVDTRSVYLALLRGSDTTEIGRRLRSVHEEEFVAPLRVRMSGPDAGLRARLAAALVGGLLYSLWVVGDEELLATDHDQIVERYGALLQELITPTEPTSRRH
ncbi:TetR family transcriptional regulator [Herbiconiux sp. UC225_62]|uniref:TetR/AcrR family transcriptional regulator n=1 Tax=Herbiconiux sp. UC225_62 TaxID=3350168 RepID=UPI0036D386CF